MTTEPITFKDKKGRTVVLRAAEPDDADDLIRYLKVTSGETPFLLREPDEVTITLETERAFIRERLDSERELMLLALVEGRLAGCCSLMCSGPYRRTRHRCGIAAALYREYCGCGIGKRLIGTVLDMAAGAGYEQAELEAVTGNTAAVALYEKLGFRKFGIFPDSMKYPDGTYADTCWMMKKLGADEAP